LDNPFLLLQQLCSIPAPSGNEGPLKAFIIDYVKNNCHNWKCIPTIIEGEEFQDAFLLVFGTPRTAVFAHLDSIGFTVRYDNKLVQIGGPDLETGYQLVGEDSNGPIEANLVADHKGHIICLDIARQIDPGTELTFKPNFRQDEDFISCCYLDNRAGIYTVLKVAETLEHGILAFSCWEEHGGGSVSVLAKYIYENFRIRQALISDITWVTEGVKHGLGPAISIRDESIPRRSYVNKLIDLAKSSNIPYQIEVEAHGGSDGRELQKSPYPFDWCFICAAETNVHSPDETIHIQDLNNMILLYDYLLKQL
jgi:putative aminopeptidase FrvX